MAHVMKRRRLANPHRRRMSPAQIAHFGTRRQKAALLRKHPGMARKLGLKNRARGSEIPHKWGSRRFRRAARRSGLQSPQAEYYRAGRQKRFEQRLERRYGNRRNQDTGGIVARAEHAAQSAIHAVERAAEDAIGAVTGMRNRGRRNAGKFSIRKTKKALKRSHGYKFVSPFGRTSGYRKRRRFGNRSRRKNVGEILTIVPANPGRKRRGTVARARNYRRNRHRRNWRDPRTGLANRRRRHNYRRHNRGHRNRARIVYRNRHRRNRMYNRRHRNPGFMTGTTGAIFGVLGGGLVTKVITGFLPSQMTTGFVGYLTTGVTAVVTGQVAGKVFKNPNFGRWMTIGGLLIVALEVVNQYFPQLQLPFGLSTGTSGLGLISSSNYYVPQVNMPGSMASFVTPAGVTAAIPVVPATGMSGIGGPQFQPGLRTMRRIGRMR